MTIIYLENVIFHWKELWTGLFRDDYNFVLAAHVKPIAGMTRPGV